MNLSSRLHLNRVEGNTKRRLIAIEALLHSIKRLYPVLLLQPVADTVLPITRMDRALV